MSVVFKLEGLEEAISRIHALGVATKEAVKQQVGESALSIQRGAKQRVPVDTGALRNSITVDFYQLGMTAEIAPHMPYARYVEFGTGRRGAESALELNDAMTQGISYNESIAGTRAHPYMFPAFEEERPRYEEGIRQAIRRTIR